MKALITPEEIKQALERDLFTNLDNHYSPSYRIRIVNEVRSAFKSVAYDLREFYKGETPDIISARKVRYQVLSYFLEWSPLKYILTSNDPDNKDYFGNGKLLAEQEFLFRKDKRDSWSPQQGHVYYLKDYILEELFFIESEEEFWDWIAEGNGNYEELSAFYKDNYSEDKQFDFLTYVIKKDTDERELYVEELKENCLYMNYWDFFTESHWETAKKAWDSGIIELRQEFVRDDEAIAMLKRILSE